MSLWVCGMLMLALAQNTTYMLIWSKQVFILWLNELHTSYWASHIHFETFSQPSHAHLSFVPKGNAQHPPTTNHLGRSCVFSSCKRLGVCFALGLVVVIRIQCCAPVPPLGFPRIYEGWSIDVMLLWKAVSVVWTFCDNQFSIHTKSV